MQVPPQAGSGSTTWRVTGSAAKGVETQLPAGAPGHRCSKHGGSRRRSTAQQQPCLQVQRAELIQRDGAAAVAVVQPYHLCAARTSRHVRERTWQAACVEPTSSLHAARTNHALLGCCYLSPGRGTARRTCEHACRLKCRPPSAIARCSSSALMAPVRSVSMAWMQEAEHGGERGSWAQNVSSERTGSSGGCTGVPLSCAAEPHHKPLLYLLLQLRHGY